MLCLSAVSILSTRSYWMCNKASNKKIELYVLGDTNILVGHDVPINTLDLICLNSTQTFRF